MKNATRRNPLRWALVACLLSPTLLAQEPATKAELGERLARALDEFQARSGLPGVSVAVIREREILWAGGAGVKLRGMDGDDNQVDAQTLFQAASISKPIAAFAALRMVAAGELELDAPIDDHLGEWKLEREEASGAEPVTLRRLLSHTAGTTVHGFPGYAPGVDLPEIVAVLGGDGNTAKILVDIPPGSTFRYSGGGYCVMQHALTQVRGEPFPKILRELVLEPAGMTSSSYEQPLPTDQELQAALAHDGRGQPYDEPWCVYPELAAAGLWTTPSDLARALLAVDAARRGEPDALLPPELIEQMLSPQPNSAECGLGWMLGQFAGEDVIRHGGSNQGFKCDAMLFPEGGNGIVIMINSDQARSMDALRSALNEVLAGDQGR